MKYIAKTENELQCSDNWLQIYIIVNTKVESTEEDGVETRKVTVLLNCDVCLLAVYV